jgi:3-hydroxyisobutyrate dehydrogenase
MGWPMASHLVKGGYEVFAFDAMPETLEKFTAEVGGHACASLRDVGTAAQIVITMVPTSKVVRAIVLGENGIASALRPGAVAIDMSSGVPGETVELAAELEARGIELVDAPVSGGTRRAITADLTIIAGGGAKTIESITPILRTLGRSVTRMGSIGAGQVMKALNNLAQAGSFLIALEALLIAKKFGLDPDQVVDVLNSSSGMNYNTQTKFKQFLLSGTFAAGFSLDLLVKDIGIALQLADQLDAIVPISSACQTAWSEALDNLGAGHDHTEIAKVAARAVGVTFP